MDPLKILAFALLASLMLQSGMETSWTRLRSFLSDYSLLGRALLANFILVPLLAVVLVRGFHLRDEIAAGILLMAVAPGVPLLPNVGGRKHGGSLSFALELVIIMPALSILTAPLTARLIFPPNMLGSFPVTSVIVTLAVAQLLPLVIGLFVASRAPQLAAKAVRPLGAVVGVLALILLVVLAPNITRAVATVWGSLGGVTAFIVVLVSVGIGWLLGGPDTSCRHTLALATALRNPGLALVVATTDFPKTPVAEMVFTFFLIQMIVGLLFGWIFARSMKAPGAPATAAPA